MASAHSSIDFAVLQQAAEWFALLRSDGVQEHDRLAWQGWLESRPQHRQAWQRVEAISVQFERLPQGTAARSALQAHGVGRRHAVKMLSLLGGAGALLLVGRSAPWQQWQAGQRTTVGQVHDTLLSDGSRLWLNTDSALDLDFSTTQRRLSLYCGELFIEAAADPRPLWVDTGHGRLQMRGRRFSVREYADATQVVAFDGVAEVLDVPGLRLESGQQLLFSRDLPGQPAPLRAGMQAWTQGVLQADAMRLGDFIAELSRYQRGHLGCDPRVAELRLVGAFPLSDPARIFTALEASLPVRVVRTLPWWISVEPRVAVAV